MHNFVCEKLQVAATASMSAFLGKLSYFLSRLPGSGKKGTFSLNPGFCPYLCSTTTPSIADNQPCSSTTNLYVANNGFQSTTSKRLHLVLRQPRLLRKIPSPPAVRRCVAGPAACQQRDSCSLGTGAQNQERSKEKVPTADPGIH
jgi:hypothetical protein